MIQHGVCGYRLSLDMLYYSYIDYTWKYTYLYLDMEAYPINGYSLQSEEHQMNKTSPSYDDKYEVFYMKGVYAYTYGIIECYMLSSPIVNSDRDILL